MKHLTLPLVLRLCFISFCLVFIASCDSSSEKNTSRNISWEHYFGGAEDESAEDIASTKDGGYVVAGGSNSSGNKDGDVWVFKLNSSGDVEWENTFGGNKLDSALSIATTREGGYVVAGYTFSKGAGSMDIIVLKLNKLGELEWERIFGGVKEDIAYSIIQTKDSGYAVAGGTTSSHHTDNAWIVKLDSDGKLEWEKKFGERGRNYIYSIIQTNEGGYILAGETGSGNNTDALIMELDSEGNIIWKHTYGDSKTDKAIDILQLSNGNLVFVGIKGGLGDNLDYDNTGNGWVMEIDVEGNIQWEKILDKNENDLLTKIIKNKKGEYILVGLTGNKEDNYDFDMWIVKLDARGNEEWNRTLGGDEYHAGLSITNAKDGGFATAGSGTNPEMNNMDAWIRKFIDD